MLVVPFQPWIFYDSLLKTDFSARPTSSPPRQGWHGGTALGMPGLRWSEVSLSPRCLSGRVPGTWGPACLQCLSVVLHVVPSRRTWHRHSRRQQQGFLPCQPHRWDPVHFQFPLNCLLVLATEQLDFIFLNGFCQVRSLLLSGLKHNLAASEINGCCIIHFTWSKNRFMYLPRTWY